jgi:hypothetical protein
MWSYRQTAVPFGYVAGWFVVKAGNYTGAVVPGMVFHSLCFGL